MMVSAWINFILPCEIFCKLMNSNYIALLVSYFIISLTNSQNRYVNGFRTTFYDAVSHCIPLWAERKVIVVVCISRLACPFPFFLQFLCLILLTNLAEQSLHCKMSIYTDLEPSLQHIINLSKCTATQYVYNDKL